MSPSAPPSARPAARVLPDALSNLPDHPDPDQLRRQAKALLRAWRAGDAAARARVERYRLPPPARLAQAQLVLAREHGFASWRALIDEVERRRDAALAEPAFVERVLTLVLGRGYDAPRPGRALALLRERPGLGALLQRWPALAWIQGQVPPGPLEPASPLAPWGATPLALVAFSSLAREGLGDALAAALARLLDAGADPNAALPDPDSAHRPLPALYGTVARSRSLAMAERLLAAGADPNDHESLYHAVESGERGFVAALVRHGARWTGTNALFRQLDVEAPEHLAQVLALGADPNEISPSLRLPPLAHAVQRGRSMRCLALLLEHGADPAVRDDHGHDLAWHAARCGRRDVLAWLATLGQQPPDEPGARFIAACAAADEPAARALLAAHPGLLERLPPHDLCLLPEQAQRGAFDSVALMLALGWPVVVKGPWDASALNQAAFRGDAAMVRLLLAHGARWHETNGYGGTALGSCLHAGTNEPVPGGDYAAVLALLLADGAPPPDEDDELPEAMAAAVAAWAAGGG